SASERGRHPRRAGQQHVPLHRLGQNHRGGEIRRRAAREWSGAVNGVAPLAGCAPSPLVGEGWGGGWCSDASAAPLASPLMTPTPDPSPQGGGEQRERSG